jgi:two-component system response regulator YesN
MSAFDTAQDRQILVIDDDQFVRDFAVHTIEFGTNSKVTTFESGFRAWQYIQSNPSGVTIVIADANIPDMSGLEVLEQLKQHHPNKTFIITSSNPDHEKAAYHMGADAFVAKPFDVNDLLTVVQKLILISTPKPNSQATPA